MGFLFVVVRGVSFDGRVWGFFLWSCVGFLFMVVCGVSFYGRVWGFFLCFYVLSFSSFRCGV